jgi:predicted AAA+ superfamily ATPase
LVQPNAKPDCIWFNTAGWEHYVLNEVQGRLQRRDLRYWRNKHGAEVDFVVPERLIARLAAEPLAR